MPCGRKSNIASFSSPLFLFSLSPVQPCAKGAVNFQGHEQISLSTAYTQSDKRVVARDEKVSDGKSMATEYDEQGYWMEKRDVKETVETRKFC